MENYKCICGREFMNSQAFNGHKSHCKEHQIEKYGNLDKLFISDNIRHNSVKKTCANKFKDYYISKIENDRVNLENWISEQHKCEKCGKVMTEYFGSGRFCSRACANTRNHSIETKEKIKKSFEEKNKELLNKYYKNPKRCVICGNIINYECSRRKTCSKKCKYLLKYPQEYNKSVYKLYRKQCHFTFKLYDYYDELDLDLINIYGMYKIYSSSNRLNNNINGVSRDHMYSILDGFVNKVDPYLISHPANCKIIKQIDNASKHSNSSITLDELMERVEKFNIKYGYYKNNIDYTKLEEFNNFNKESIKLL